MSCKRFSSFNIVLLLLLGAGKIGEGCDPDGLNCLSCTDYQNCSRGFPSGKIISCKSGKDCDDDELKKCKVKLNCYASNECLQVGIFPDTTNESNYFVCLSDGGTGFLKYDFTCQDGFFFDKSLLSCVPKSATITSDTVSSTSISPEEEVEFSSTDSPDSTSPSSSSTTPSNSPDPTSPSTEPTTTPTSSSSNSPDPTSPSTEPTTIPTSTQPTTPNPTSSSSSTQTTTPTPTTPSTEPTTPTPTTPSTQPTTPTPGPKFTCTGPGIFPNPDNCKIYYRCSTSLKAFTYICPGNSYFNENILKCSMIITPACKEQILKNSMSTIPPITTPTTPKSTTTTTTTTTTAPMTTTTPKPTTMASTTTTTPQPPPPVPTTTTTTPRPFSCPMAGTFENPSNCKTYYRCSTSGKVFVYVCPGATYFNEITKRCSLTITPRCKSLILG